MLKLNFLLAIRQLKKDKKSFLINLLGSSIGFTAIVLMILYISYENNYDAFNVNDDRLFRIERTVNDKVQSQIFDTTPYELAEEIKISFPEVSNATSVRTVRDYLSNGNDFFSKKEGLIADNSFLKMFSFEFLNGNKNNALSQPMSIVLSESLASILFTEGNAIGKTVRVNKKYNVKVTGVFTDYRKDSHMTMDYIVSYSSYEGLYGMKRNKGWDENYSCTYILVNENTEMAALSKKIKNVLSSHVTKESGSEELLSLRPISDIYLKTLNVRSNAMAGIRNNIIVIYLFLSVAFFTAFITIVNYINLTTTQLVNREKEIGMKKVLGISKVQLRYQFIIESLLVVFGIIIISSIMIYLILPVFSTVVGRNLSLGFNGNWLFFFKIFITSILLGFLGGLYPVFYLSSLKITSFLRGNTSIKRRNFLRKGLVFFQLLIAIPLIFLSVFIIKQINFLQEKDLGFEKENLLLAWVKTPNEQDKERLRFLKNTLQQNPNVLDYSISEGAPFFASGGEKKVNWEGGETNDKIRLTFYAVDYDFLETYKMTLKKGRWFSKNYGTDVLSNCIINETAASLLGWENPIGKTINDGQLKIIGVVKDFNQFSLFQKVPPMMLLADNGKMDSPLVSVKVNSNNRLEAQKLVNTLFNDSFSEMPIEFKFLDVGFDEGFMSALENVMRIFILFSIISIVLVVIGLYGLISFSLKMQKKMIAVRKVLGASTKNLFLFILKEYMILYGIAITISIILTYITILQISQVFAYSVALKFIDFLSVILITLFIVLITVCGKIWTASKENPIEAISTK